MAPTVSVLMAASGLLHIPSGNGVWALALSHTRLNVLEFEEPGAILRIRSLGLAAL